MRAEPPAFGYIADKQNRHPDMEVDYNRCVSAFHHALRGRVVREGFC